VRLVALRELERLARGVRGVEALDPRLAGEQHPEAPVHDVLVVDEQHSQPAVLVARADGAVETRCERGRRLLGEYFLVGHRCPLNYSRLPL
jgi:hypothetical protein